MTRHQQQQEQAPPPVPGSEQERHAAQGPRVADSQFSKHNVLAVFPTMEAARNAMHALSKGTIEADNISLLGEAAEEAAESPRTREIDARLIQYQARNALTGGAIGAVIGAIAGIPIGIAVLSVITPATTVGNVLFAVAFSALAFGIVGALVAFFNGLQPSEPWVLAFQRSRAPGKPIVGVHSNETEVIEAATEILREESPLEMYRANSRGRMVDRI